MIYGQRSNGNDHGIVLTKPVIVTFMLNRIGYEPDRDLSELRIIEPASGDGAFAIEIIDRLYSSSLKYQFSFQEALENLEFYELDYRMSNLLTERIRSRLTQYSALLPDGLIKTEDFLASKAKKCDYIIGNPPYVRHENIPENQKNQYRKKFRTFTHRSDLYIAFYEKGLRLLKEDGILSYICSNRWLRNQYGKNLRELIQSSFNLTEIIDLEDTCPFEEDVIAYPAITTIHKSISQKTANYFKVNDIAELDCLDSSKIKSRSLSLNNSANWFSYQTSNTGYEKYLDSIENQGFKIGIGVATGADKIFIRKDFPELVEEEVILPILQSKDLKNNSFQWSGNYILNPFSNEGKLIDLDNFPKTKKYLYAYRDRLLKRYVAQKKPHLWFKTIDKIKPSLTKENKILLPDISGNSHLFIDTGNFYPHHNLYYISGQGYKKLKILAAILMSDFVKNQLLELGNKMNGGYPRWQSQNLRKLRVPMLNSIPKKIIDQILTAYDERNYDLINNLITENTIKGFSIQVGQTKLFEPETVYDEK